MRCSVVLHGGSLGCGPGRNGGALLGTEQGERGNNKTVNVYAHTDQGLHLNDGRAGK